MKKFLAVSAMLVVANYAFANEMTKAFSNKSLVCTSSNYVKVEIDARRTMIRVSQMGEFWGQEAVADSHTDGRTFVSYFTQSGILTFNSDRVTFDFKTTGKSISLKCR